MVMDMVLGWGLKVVQWLLGLDPHIPVPSWVSDSSPVGKIFALADSMQAWLPLPLLFTVGYFLIVTIVASFGFKVGRIVLSFLTAGGGSAG